MKTATATDHLSSAIGKTCFLKSRMTAPDVRRRGASAEMLALARNSARNLRIAPILEKKEIQKFIHPGLLSPNSSRTRKEAKQPMRQRGL